MDSTNVQPRSRTLGDYAGLLARGFAMGSSDIVPGVSGGTMALILGIYDELVSSVRAVVDRDAIKLLLRLKIAQALQRMPWQFLVAVASGLFLAIFSMSYLWEWLLQNHPSLLWALFFGLVAASVVTVAKRVQQWKAPPVVGAVVGAVGVYLIVGLVPGETPDTWWFWVLSGAIAICGMVLPGVSGAFIMVLFGKYEQLLSAVTNRQVGTLLLVIVGATVGIVTLAQVLGWLFKRYPDGMAGVLGGMLLGSLRKVWPWKETIETILDRHGEPIPLKQVNVLPAAWTWEVTLAILLAIAGFATIVSLNARAAARRKGQAHV